MILAVFACSPWAREASFLCLPLRAVPPPNLSYPAPSRAAQPSTDAISFLLPLQTNHTNGTAQLSPCSLSATAGQLLDTQLVIVMTLRTLGLYATLL